MYKSEIQSFGEVILHDVNPGVLVCPPMKTQLANWRTNERPNIGSECSAVSPPMWGCRGLRVTSLLDHSDPKFTKLNLFFVHGNSWDLIYCIKYQSEVSVFRSRNLVIEVFRVLQGKKCIPKYVCANAVRVIKLNVASWVNNSSIRSTLCTGYFSYPASLEPLPATPDFTLPHRQIQIYPPAFPLTSASRPSPQGD